MFHKPLKLEYREGTAFDVTFQTGEVKHYDVSVLFAKYPQMEALKERALFLSGKMSAYGIIWNDALDLELETVYEDGELIQTVPIPQTLKVGNTLQEARARAGLTQVELSKRCGIDQAEISRIERGMANPSVETLERIATGLNMQLEIRFTNTPLPGLRGSCR